MNFAPCGSFLSAHRRPPCNSTIERQIASPIPIPSRFVVTNGSNILSSDSIPPPRSLISVCTTSPIRRVRIQSTFSPETERSEEHTSELQSLMRNSYAVLCLKKKKNNYAQNKEKTNNTSQRKIH